MFPHRPAVCSRIVFPANGAQPYAEAVRDGMADLEFTTSHHPVMASRKGREWSPYRAPTAEASGLNSEVFLGSEADQVGLTTKRLNLLSFCWGNFSRPVGKAGDQKRSLPAWRCPHPQSEPNCGLGIPPFS
jgi:hypothetical protein